MAPRGRPRKSRDTRMDAAVDAMTKNYGFPEEIVKRVAKELLKEYEGDQGDEGWFFIEDCSYQVLVDALLLDQELNDRHDAPPNQKEDALPQNISLQDERAAEHALAEPSGVVSEANCSKVVENQLEANTKEDAGQLPSSGRDGKGWKDIGLDQSSSEKGRAAGISDKDEIGGSSQDCANSVILTPLSLTPTTPGGSTVSSPPENCPVLSPFPKISPPNVKRVQSKRCQPCNGWIFESDEEEDEDMIDLKPAIEWEHLSWGTVKKAKRGSRWDLRPEDI
ncbi:unnamed protein product [Coffea canephora]|uniref:WIYLD domain-containing protein n=1 Tax=Coffea canephora TaxID=49390 RepID=A0A068V0K5_COFCA|nr:unnamed protein product [Coffea canephora]